MEILGRSKERDYGMQRRLAAHPILSAHPGIVKVLGETSDGRFILNELAPLGSLTNYDGSTAVLNAPDGRRATTAVRLEMASQILDASTALLDAGLLHRDLAARNVLAFKFHSTDPELVEVKLTDFGLTIPIGGDPAWPPGHAMGTRWMAPEAQPTDAFEFSEASEVYSFGVLLYEIMASGRVPYAHVGNAAIPKVKRRGGPPPGPRPEGCPAAVYELMELCWEHFPVNRPSFKELRALIDELQASDGSRLRPAPARGGSGNGGGGGGGNGSGGDVVLQGGEWTPEAPQQILALDERSLAPEFIEIVVGLRTPEKAEAVGAAGARDNGARSSGLPPGVTRHHVDRELGAILSFPLFTEEFCDVLVNELAQFHAEGRTTARANSNNRHSLRVVEVGKVPKFRPWSVTSNLVVTHTSEFHTDTHTHPLHAAWLGRLSGTAYRAVRVAACRGVRRRRLWCRHRAR